MLELVILSIIVLLLTLVLFVEYSDNKRFQNKIDKKSTEPKNDIFEEEKIPQEEPEPQVVEEALEKTKEVEPEAVEEIQAEEVKPEPEPEPEIVPEEIIKEVQPEVIEEEVVETKELPECEYPPFTHVRLVEMGLSDDEATEFVHELIPQLEEQIPLIENAINSADYHQIEKLTHGIKGSATNIGTGGVADLLTEFNTYLKSETDVDVVKAYQTHFIRYIEELKKQYT